jgi:hypothetical protein
MRGSAVKSRELPAAAPSTGFTVTEEKDSEAGGTKLGAAVPPATRDTPIKEATAGLLSVNCSAESTVATVLPGARPGPDTTVPTARPAVLDTFTVFDPKSTVTPLNKVELPPLTTTLTRPTLAPPGPLVPPETYRCTKYG